MKATKIRFKAKVLNPNPASNPENGYVEGFYYQDLDNGVVKHYIHNCPMTWEVDPSTVRFIGDLDLDKYKNPKTTKSDIKDLHKLLVQTCVNFIKKRNLTDIYEVNFGVDGLENDAIEFGEWTPGMDSSLSVVGLQKEDDDYFRVRKIIGESY